MEVSGQLHASAALTPREKASSTHCIRGWVGSRAGLGRGNEEKKFLLHPFLELNTGRPARTLFTILTELPQLVTLK